MHKIFKSLKWLYSLVPYGVTDITFLLIQSCLSVAQASSSLNILIHVCLHIPYPLLQKKHSILLVMYVQLFLITIKDEFMAYTASAFTIHFTCKATPTNDTNYSCHTKAVELV